MSLSQSLISAIVLSLTLNLIQIPISAHASSTDSSTAHSSQINETSHDETHNVIQSVQTVVDDHHSGHSITANFIPKEILNPDDSIYQVPSQAKQYAGDYQGRITLPNHSADLLLNVTIQPDGLLNLAYYFEPMDENNGLRFYVDQNNTIQSMPAPYQDLVLLTAGIQENNQEELYAGLIRETLSPVVLINSEGKSDTLYPYHTMAYDLRENLTHARVYQNIGLYLIDNEVVIDVNHLIGDEDGEDLVVTLEKVESLPSEDAFLTEQTTYELLQHSFDHYLVEHNDFKMDFQNANEFVQFIQALHLQTNKRFPKETTFELISPDKVKQDLNTDHSYALIINDSILYTYDGSNLYVAENVEFIDGQYTAEKWLTN
ncbi:hypothetical protein HZY86_05070 [Aerococcaceae bacterium DSM 111020]|nr:hypothetical protein [Aerococcaceae bacterium DSM 111020]